MRRTGEKSLIGGIVALSLILTGTGYAYWTDTLNLTTRATTGDFDVTFADMGLYAQYDNELRESGWSIVDGLGEDGYTDHMFFARGDDDYNSIARVGSIDEYYEKAEAYNSIEFNAELEDSSPIKKDVGPYTSANTNGSDQINIEVLNMYPGYAQAFRTDILNVGELAAKLGKMEFSATAEDDSQVAKEMLGIALYIGTEEHPEGNNGDVFELAEQFDAEDLFRVGGVDFVRLSALEEKDFVDVFTNNELLCNSTQRADLYLGIAMDPDEEGIYTTGTAIDLKENDDTLSQLQEVEVTIDFIWEQFNVGTDNANPNILIEQNR